MTKNSFRTKVEAKLASLEKKDSFSVRLLPGFNKDTFQNRITYIIWNYYKTRGCKTKKFTTERVNSLVKVTRVK
jgi:hypothetical protein